MQKDQLQQRYQNNLKIPMYSTAGRVFSKQLVIQILTNSKKKYKSKKNQKIQFQNIKKDHHKSYYSPFKTISRSINTSYMNRNIKQSHAKTNYQYNHQLTQVNPPNFTINKTKFIRRLNYSHVANDKQYQDDFQSLSQSCSKSFKKYKNIRRFSTVSDYMDFGKNNKKTNSKKQMDRMISTTVKTLNSKQQTKENNLRERQEQDKSKKYLKTHSFESSKGHRYLIMKKQKRIPIFDAQNINWNYIRKYWNGDKANLRFDKFREKVRIRNEKSQQSYNSKLEYNTNESNNKITQNNIHFQKQISRYQNTIPNKIPIRLNQRIDYGQKKYMSLNQLLKIQINKTIFI